MNHQQGLEPPFNALRVRAEMARRGLLPVQRQTYWDPDTDSDIFPNQDVEVIASMISFLSWLDKECQR